MAKIVAIANQKGGVAKTTSTYNIAAILSSQGKNVLMVDLDPQSSLTISAGIEIENLQYTSKDLFNPEIEPAYCAITLKSLNDLENFYIIPADISLSQMELELFTRTNRERQLKKALMKLDPYFDYIFIDCPPALGLLTLNALVAANEVIIPCTTELLAYRGMRYILATIKDIQKKENDLNPELKVAGVIATRFKGALNDHKDILSLIRDLDVPFLGVIKDLSEAAKCVIDGLPVVMAKPSCQVARAYYMVCDMAGYLDDKEVK